MPLPADDGGREEENGDREGRGEGRKEGRRATMVRSAPVRPSVCPFVRPLVGLGWNPITSSGVGGVGGWLRRRRRRNRRGWREAGGRGAYPQSR